MHNQMPAIIKEAELIAEKANSLTNQLKTIPIEKAEIIMVGVDPFVFAVTIFTLACIIGYYVVWKVTPSLHTPLMSLTNAISAIIIIGALISASSSELGLSSILGFIAAFFAAINISGGFIVTERMLKMFKKK